MPDHQRKNMRYHVPSLPQSKLFVMPIEERQNYSNIKSKPRQVTHSVDYAATPLNKLANTRPQQSTFNAEKMMFAPMIMSSTPF